MVRFLQFLLLLVVCSLSSAPVALAVCDSAWFAGEGTQYGGVAGSNGGNCGIWVDEGDIYTCALNHSQYDSSLACGACIHAFGPIGDIVVKVVDRCPECKPGDIDFSTGAFVKVARLEDGRVPIRWQFVPCPLAPEDRTVKVLVDAGTSPYYFKAMFSNLYVGLQKVEFLNDEGGWTPIHREMYNYFVYPGGIGQDKANLGPYTFRLTSWTGEQLVAENIEVIPDEESDLRVQFAETYCPEDAGVEAATNNAPPIAPGRVEVFDLMGRRLLSLPEWVPSALAALPAQVVLVRQRTTAGVVVRKWVVR